MNDTLVSIIVAVWNVEAYLQRCIESLLTQTHSSLEIILVDDGSTDKSGDICDNFAAKDKRIKVIHKINGGASSARNQAIDIASGKWIWFVDADDYVENNALEILIQMAEMETCDMVMAGYVVEDEYGRKKLLHTKSLQKLLTYQDGLLEMFAPKDYPYQGYVWNKLFRTSIIKETNLRFEEDIHFNEDRLFVVQYLCKSMGNVAYTTQPVYNYCQREGSLMKSCHSGYDPRYASDFKAYTIMYKTIKQAPVHPSILRLARRGIAMSFLTNHKMMIDNAQLDDKLHKTMSRDLLCTNAWTQYLSLIFKEATRELLYWGYPQLLIRKK